MNALARRVAGLSAGLIFSRILGLFRDMLAAWLLGTGPMADALAVASRLPHLMRRLLGEGVLSMTTTADLIRAAQSGKHDRAGRESFLLLIFLLVLAGELCAPGLIGLLAPGLAPQTAAQAAFLLRICLPYALLASVAAMDMAAMHAAGCFAAPALSPALFNIVFVASTLAALWLHPSAGQQYMAEAMALGMLAGGIAQVALQRLALRRSSFRLISGPAPLTLFTMHSVRGLGRICLGIFGAAGLQLAMLCAMLESSWLPGGSVAALSYAERLMELPVGVTGAAVGMAGLPVMAALAAQGRYCAFADNLSFAMRMALLMALPAAAGLVAVADNLVRTLLQYGAFNEESAVLTALALSGYAPGLPSYALIRPLIAACNAQNDVLSPAWSGVLLIVCTVASGFLLINILPAKFILAGPALGVSIGLWAQAAMLWRIVSRRLARQGIRLIRPEVRAQVAGSVLVAVVAFYTGRIMPGHAAGLLLSVCGGILAYVIFMARYSGSDLKSLRDIFRNKSALP